jgi:hypothetical protein
MLLVTSTLMLSVNGGTESPKVPERATAPIPGTSRLSNELIIANNDNLKYSPKVTYNSIHDEYLVVWENTQTGGALDIFARRVSSQGQLLNSFTVATGSKSRIRPSVAYDPVNDRYLVVWIYDVNGDDSNWDVYGRFIPWDGPSDSLTEFAIYTGNSSQRHPQVAYARTQKEFLVIWVNDLAPTSISGRRIPADGSPLPDNGFIISSGPDDRDSPALAYNLARNEYLVTWEVNKAVTGFDIYAVRLRGDGVPTGGDEFAIATHTEDDQLPAVAACHAADQYMVAWQRRVSGDDDIYGSPVSGNSIPGSDIQIDATTLPEQAASVACDQSGMAYLIAWQTEHQTFNFGISARLVYPDGTMKPTIEVVDAGNNANRTHPSVAGGQAQFLAVWEHQRDGTNYQDIHGRLVWPNVLFLPLIEQH